MGGGGQNCRLQTSKHSMSLIMLCSLQRSRHVLVCVGSSSASGRVQTPSQFIISWDFLRPPTWMFMGRQSLYICPTYPKAP